MPHFKLKYTAMIPDRKGRVRWFFRDRQKNYTLLRGEPGSPEFMVQYAKLLAALQADTTKTTSRPATGSLHELIAAFKGSPKFKNEKLAGTSIEYYTRQLDRLSCLGKFQAKDIGRRQILQIRDKLADRGERTADQFVQVASALFSFGIQHEFVTHNPARGIEKIADSQSYLAWTDEEAEKFEMSKPPRWAITAYLIGRYAAPRRGDVLRLTKSNYDGQKLVFTPSKTKKKTGRQLTIPVHSRLKAHLDGLTVDIGPLVCRDDGRPWEARAFSKAFRKLLDAAGLQHLHFHGLRHMAGRTLAELRCTDREIMAITGHSSVDMVQRYTKAADQTRLAALAIQKLEVKR